MVLLLLLGVLLLFLVVGILYQRNADRRDARRYPPPGKVVNVPRGDVELHLQCQGQGDVTVVLEAGQGDSSLDWATVQSAASAFTRVCAYDRPGLGWSSLATGPLTSQQIAENLHHALKVADIAGPYLLVGHSIGGVYVRAFAQQFPDDVAGFVFVDSAHENQLYRLPPKALQGLTMMKRFARVLGALTLVGIPRALRLADRLQGEDFPPDIRPAAMARMYQSHFFKALFNDVRAVELNAAQSDPPADLGATPLIVLSRGETNPGPPDEQFEQLKQIWGDMQLDLVRLSSNSRHIVADKSGHYIHHDQPDLVVDAIRQLVEALPNDGGL